jgi:hypothetical protein
VSEDKAAAIRRIRREMELFGYPMAAFSDEEIEAGVRRFAEAAKAAGITAAQAAEALSRVALLDIRA